MDGIGCLCGGDSLPYAVAATRSARRHRLPLRTSIATRAIGGLVSNRRVSDASRNGGLRDVFGEPVDR